MIDFCETRRNPDYLTQCKGCDNIDILIRKNAEKQDGAGQVVTSAILHKNFDELDRCARKCDICRVFRQALILEEVTFERVKELSNSTGDVLVSWNDQRSNICASTAYLSVEIAGDDKRPGVVICSKENGREHLALRSHSLSTFVIEQAREWLETCVNDHVGECDNLAWNDEPPQLLIEILSSESIRLRENHEGRYVALSYCWGDTRTFLKVEKDEVDRGMTLNSNLRQRKDPFPIADLPHTVRDAIAIVRALGIRFVWIDTLCINQDTKEGVSMMHKVYSNALFTLCACATTRATSKLLDQREAWTHSTEPCRLGGQWLTTPDMSLNELRLRSPLAERAWTLQEERLSPRMLYVSSNRIHWSCCKSSEMEMRTIYGRKDMSSQRPIYAATDRHDHMPRAQEFLLACYAGSDNLHRFWEDIVTSYAMRNMSDLTDRLKALSGLATKYLDASIGDQYLAGLWANNLAEGLAWRVVEVIESAVTEKNAKVAALAWPSWTWAVLPVQSAIELGYSSPDSPHFQMSPDGYRPPTIRDQVEVAISQGEAVKQICVTGRLRSLWRQSSQHVDWSVASRKVGGNEKFSFATIPGQDIHSIHDSSGRILVYEDGKKEILVQLDFRQDVIKVQSCQLYLSALEIGASSMLVLEKVEVDVYRRVGVAWNVRPDYFASGQITTLILT
jgi:hypothetical protein